MSDTGTVHYNYPLMDSIAAGIGKCGAVAEALLLAGQQTKTTLRATFESAGAAPAFDTSFLTFESVNQQTIEIVNKGSHHYADGTAQMLLSDHQQGTVFP